MIIRVKKSWKDFVTHHHEHNHLSRRDFIERGLATGVMSLAIPKLLAGKMIQEALADGTAACPVQTRVTGGLVQLFSNGGDTRGAQFLNEFQANLVNSDSAAKGYGVVKGDVVRLDAINGMPGASSVYVSKSSPFGAAIQTPPAGFNLASWQQVLSRTSLAAHYGPFNADDGGGDNSGLLGAASAFKPATFGKDLRIGNSVTLAKWAPGMPSTSVGSSGLAPASFSSVFALSPAAGTATTNAGTMTNSANAALALSTIFGGIFGNTARKGTTNIMTAANCGFVGDSVLADPNYGTGLFTPTGITDLTTKMTTIGTISTAEQAKLAAFYQSANGAAGGVFIEFGGRDYHGQNAQNTIGPDDFEVGRTVALALAAAASVGTATTPGGFGARMSIIGLSNGQAIANGVTAVTAAANMGTLSGLSAPNASGDAGGTYNVGWLLSYDPLGQNVFKTSAPSATNTSGGAFSGVFDTNANDGSVSGVISSPEAVAGLYLTAIGQLYNNINGVATSSYYTNALKIIQASGLATNPSASVLLA